MTQTDPANAPEETPLDREPETETHVESAEPQAGSAEEPQDPIASLEAEILKWRDLALRSAADLDNYRKRAAKEKSEAIRYANTSLLEDLLPVIDNFEWGLQAAAADTGSPIYQGMDMVFKQITDFLENQGVQQLDATSLPFDPNIHEAVSQEPSDSVPDGHVISQTRKGYRVSSGRLLRPAAVVVSQGPASEDAADA
ncbi:MAG: nucleotide exchange factor GrpE [Verrucomicrobiales bacterium]|nr:nucleotide exchange factor GrpE [Verrucomicrobiales bacterium]